ncbi:MAG: ATP phosphoribosyltransferase regulatory subunit [Bacillota bacterium]|nr:ATP phosphoribosyltransferase regulatory subunit [Bacillota bacterium]
MIIEGADLNNREKAMFALRALYSSHGFSLYRMSKFEEFDLYARNRDFMDSASIITFTDTDGMLMALKPDVTLSIVKNNRHIGDNIRKVYYNENIYRVSPKTHYFKEIMQVGLECLGKIDDACICEVLLMAAESLKVLSDSAILDISNLDILSRIIEACDVSGEVEEKITKCVGEKNLHGLNRVCDENGIGGQKKELLQKLITLYGDPEEVLGELEEVFYDLSGDLSEESKQIYGDSLRKLNMIIEAFEGSDLKDMLRIDFSVVSDLNYYNGIIFKGFVEGVPDGVLSGGQYDKLMNNMNRKSRAIGFAVYMDYLGKLSKFDGEEVIIRG